MDYELQRCTRRCSVTGRELAPGEVFYSALIDAGAELQRLDFAEEAWNGPPDGTLGWWKSQIPAPDARRVHWAPNDVMLQFFEELQQKPELHDMRYVLALLLVRRRVMRVEDTQRDAQGREELVLYCPRRDATYRVVAATPDESRVEVIQEQLASMLFANAS